MSVGERFATKEELEALGAALSRKISAVRLRAAGGFSQFIDLLDTPTVYVEQGGKLVAVKVDEDGLEFINPGEISLEYIGTPTYKTLQDWLNNTQSAGKFSGGEIIENAAANGTIDVAAGTGFIKTTDSGIGTTKFFDWAEEEGIALTDNSVNHVYIDYNGGSPVVGVTTNRTTINGRTKFIIGRVYREGTTLHILDASINLPEAIRLEYERLLDVRGFERASGGEISEVGERYLASTAGVFYLGLNKIETSAQNTSDADRFTYWYRDGGGGWTKVANQQQIDNQHYDDGSGTLATLTTNRYGVHWVYVHFDSDINVVYGQGNYKLTEAELAVPPDTVPDLVGEFGILAAKIIVQKSGTNLLAIESAYKVLFPTTFPPQFIDLLDTPSSYQDGAERLVTVKSGEDGVEFGRKIFVSDDAPQAADGEDGDIWLEY